MFDYTSTVEEINKSGIKTAIIPLGSVEQHSSHLPIGTDCIIAEAVAHSVGERMNAFVLPVIPIGTCYEHKCAGKFTAVWLRPVTLYHIIEDIVLSLKNQGFEQIALLLGHGGLFVVGPVVRELNANNDNLTVVHRELFSDAGKSGLTECADDVHAGEIETSVMLYLKEQYVKKDDMLKNDFLPDVPRSFLNYSSILKLSNTGVWGKPSLAGKDKGEKLLLYEVEQTVEFITRAFKAATKNAW